MRRGTEGRCLTSARREGKDLAHLRLVRAFRAQQNQGQLSSQSIRRLVESPWGVGCLCFGLGLLRRGAVGIRYRTGAGWNPWPRSTGMDTEVPGTGTVGGEIQGDAMYRYR